MACYHPLEGYRSKLVNPDTGKRPVVFNTTDGYFDLPVIVPCGRCIGCRLEYSRRWAVRCYHEFSSIQVASFLTLTYNNENLPSDGSLNPRHLTLFFKRLRKKLNQPIRYFACGEYGDKLARPHYHACIFGYSFPDREYHAKSPSGHNLFTSKELSDVWQAGYSVIGDVSFESSAYVARYAMKKVNGDEADEHYQGRQPEFVRMSRMPGLGNEWLKQYHRDVYPSDEIVIQGRVMRSIPYYDKVFASWAPENEELIKKLKSRRFLSMMKWKEERPEENYMYRLEQKEKVKRAQIRTLLRHYEGAYHGKISCSDHL